MTFANNIGEWFGITNDKIWGITNQIKTYLPKFRYLNSIVSTNSYIQAKANILTDVSFRPNTYGPNRTWNVYQGLNFPIVNYLVHPGTGPAGYDWHSAVFNSTAELQYPFSVKKGLLKREHLALDAYFAHIEFTFEQKRTNALSIVQKVTNLSTHYPDNDADDYVNTIAYHQAKADHLTVCIATVDLLRSQIATNVDDINNFVENDFDADVAYTELIAALTYPTELLDYMNSYGSSWLNLPREYLISLTETFSSNPDRPFDADFYNPIRTEGRINSGETITESFNTNVSYKTLGSLYDEVFLDPTLYPKGTPLNEEHSSLRKTTNGIILGTLNILKSLQYYDYLNESQFTAYMSGVIGGGKYLTQYVHEELLNVYSTTFRFGSRPHRSDFNNAHDEYVKSHVDLGLIASVSFSPGTTDPTPDQDLKSLPKIINSAFNYKVVPKTILRAKSAHHENNTLLVGVAMLLRKTLEVDFILNTYYPTDAEDLPDSTFETSDVQYDLLINHLSPKETASYIEDANDDYPFYKVKNGPTNNLSYSSLGDRSTLIGDSKTVNYATSNNVNHLDIPERNLKQMVNVIDSNDGSLSLSHTDSISSNSDKYTKDNSESSYVHSHGREHPSLGLYDLEDLFVSASHLGDRCESEDDPPKVRYRRAYTFEDTSDPTPKGIDTSYSYTNTSSSGSTTVSGTRTELYTVTKEYVSTEDTIWFARSVDTPVPKPHLWLYKIQTYVRNYEMQNYTSFSPFYSDYISTYIAEAKVNVYLYWPGYELDAFNNEAYQDPLLLQYLDSESLWNLVEQLEWLKAKHFFKVDYYDDDGNLTSTDVRRDTDNTFTETSIDNVVNFLKNRLPPYPELAPETLGQGFYYSPSWLDNFIFGGIGTPYYFVQNRTCEQIGVRLKGSNLSALADVEYPLFNVNFEVDSPL